MQQIERLETHVQTAVRDLGLRKNHGSKWRTMERLLNVKEIAEILGVKDFTIYQWTHEGFIPHIKVGKFVRFRERDVLKWLEERSKPGRKARKVDLGELGINLGSGEKQA